MLIICTRLLQLFFNDRKKCVRLWRPINDALVFGLPRSVHFSKRQLATCVCHSIFRILQLSPKSIVIVRGHYQAPRQLHGTGQFHYLLTQNQFFQKCVITFSYHTAKYLLSLKARKRFNIIFNAYSSRMMLTILKQYAVILRKVLPSARQYCFSIWTKTGLSYWIRLKKSKTTPLTQHRGLNWILLDERCFITKTPSDVPQTLFATSGQTGDVVLDQNGDRFNSFELWTYGPGNDSYNSYMIIDTALAIDKVCKSGVQIAHNETAFQFKLCPRGNQQNCHHLLTYFNKCGCLRLYALMT